MALETNELFSQRSFAGRPRMVVERNKVGTMAPLAVAAVLPVGCPLAWNTSSSKWVPYTQPSDAAVYTIVSNATPASAGTMELHLDGLAVTIVFDATAAAIQTEVNAVLLDAGRDFTVAAVATAEANLGVASATVTLTFTENAGAPSVEIDMANLTGNVHVLAATDAGTQVSGTDEIAGFLAHQSASLGTSDDVQVTIMLAGEVHRDDINTTAMLAFLIGSPSEAELDIALKSAKLRQRGITVRGLDGVAG